MIKNHNCGYGSSSKEPAHLRFFAVMAHIAEFDGNKELMLTAEYRCKYICDDLIRSGDFCVKSWARAGECAIQNANLQLSISCHTILYALFYYSMKIKR